MYLGLSSVDDYVDQRLSMTAVFVIVVVSSKCYLAVGCNVVLFGVVSHDVLCIGLVLLHLEENCEKFSQILSLAQNCKTL